jgi:hypothetical protein
MSLAVSSREFLFRSRKILAFERRRFSTANGEVFGQAGLSAAANSIDYRFDILWTKLLTDALFPSTPHGASNQEESESPRSHQEKGPDLHRRRASPPDVRGLQKHRTLEQVGESPRADRQSPQDRLLRAQPARRNASH